MKVPINIPKLSMATDEGAPMEWLVPDGGRVEEGAELYSLETEKALTEVTAPASGIVHWEAELDEAYPVGTQIGWIETAD